MSKLKSKQKYYSVIRCAFCEPLQQSNKGYINPPTCPFTHFEIDGKIYKCDRGYIFDQAHTIDDDLVGEPCHDCVVIYGNIHHVECDSESCPVEPGEQFLGCGHDMDSRCISDVGLSLVVLSTSLAI